MTKLAVLGFVQSANAFTVSFINITATDATSVPLVDNAGDPIAVGSGFISVGTFTTAPNFTGTPGDIQVIQNTFNEFGTGNSVFSNVPSIDGFFDGSRDAPIPFGSTAPPVGESVFLVIGDGNSLATSTQFAVFDPGQVFGTDTAVGSGALDIDLNSATLDADSLLFGNILEDQSLDAVAGLVFEETIQLSDGTAAIPEPSTGLLALFAGLGLVGRRRR